MTRTVGVASMLLAAACLGCTSALSEPPAISEIGSEGVRDSQGGRNADQLAAQADLEMALAPDQRAVERARLLYLEAARTRDAKVEAFLGAASATAWLVEHEDDVDRRKVLATEGVQIAQLCRRTFPEETECRYRLALAVGQQARERPSTAADGLDVMVSLLEELTLEAPDLDHAGPHRVLALVLLRAPGWPSGPGDPEYGLEHARTAAVMDPIYAPNQLVLGEALAESGRLDEARAVIERGVELAREAQADGDKSAGEWIAKGQEALAGLH